MVQMKVTPTAQQEETSPGENLDESDEKWNAMRCDTHASSALRQVRMATFEPCRGTAPCDDASCFGSESCEDS